MLTRLNISNYRIFNEFKMDRLNRINLIVGKNNSGKTTLLEAIFLLAGAGNANLALNTNVIRGAEKGTPIDQRSVETFWKPMFYELNTSNPVKISGYDASHGPLTMDITSERQEQETIGFSVDGPDSEPATDFLGHRWLVFHYSGPGNKRVESRIRAREQEPVAELKLGHIDPPFSGTIVGPRTGDIQEDAIRLGRLRKQKRGDWLLNALKVIEPKLQSIEDNSASGTPMIWGDVGLPELIPLPAMGEGMTRIARIVLSIVTSRDGVVLLDEIETGLHHSVLPKVWEVIATAAREFNTQIFATTHSFECAEAAHHALETSDFLLHRLEANGTENRCVTYGPETIAAALQHPLEIR